MHISEILADKCPSFSFEFFPPKTSEATERLFKTIAELEKLHPFFVSITYGAGGSTRELTHELVARIKNETRLSPLPHLTCIGHTEEEIQDILVRYTQLGVGNILALRGDPPRGQIDYDHSKDTFTYAADLVRFIQKFNESGAHPHPKGFGIGVAGFPEGHPAMPNRLLEMDYLKAKIDAGADYICTQLFFENTDFYDFRDRCALAGIHVPIIAGIMPITSTGSMQRMAELAAGARFPAKLLKALARAENDADRVENVGIQYAASQCSDLLANGVDGIHFYTLNQSDAVRRIYNSLGISSVKQ